MKFILGLFTLGHFSGVFAKCGINICLNWKVSPNTLTLICRVNDLQYSVFFYDPSNKIVADCIPPYPSVLCNSNYKFNESTISQNTKTKETIFKITGTIDKFVNGNWTCKHGNKIHNTSIEVTVFDRKGKIQDLNINTGGLIPSNKSQNKDGTNDCIRHTASYGMCTYFASILLYICILMVQKNRLSRLDNIQKRMSAILRIVLVLISSMVFAIVCLVAGILDSLNKTCTVQYVFLVLGISVGTLVGIVLIRIEVTGSTEKEKTGGLRSSNNAGIDNGNDVEDGKEELVAGDGGNIEE